MEKVRSLLLIWILTTTVLTSIYSFELDPFIFQIEHEDNTSDPVSQITVIRQWPLERIPVSWPVQTSFQFPLPLNRDSLQSKITLESNNGGSVTTVMTVDQSGMFDFTGRFNLFTERYRVDMAVELHRPFIMTRLEQSAIKGERFSFQHNLLWYQGTMEQFAITGFETKHKISRIELNEAFSVGIDIDRLSPVVVVQFGISVDEIFTPALYFHYVDKSLRAGLSFNLERSWINFKVVSDITTNFQKAFLTLQGEFGFTFSDIFTLKLVKIDIGRYDAAVTRFSGDSPVSAYRPFHSSMLDEHGSVAALDMQITRGIFFAGIHIISLYDGILFQTDFRSSPYIEVPDLSGMVDLFWHLRKFTLKIILGCGMDRNLLWQWGGGVLFHRIKAGPLKIDGGITVHAAENGSSLTLLATGALFTALTRQGWFFIEGEAGPVINNLQSNPVPGFRMDIEAGFRTLF